MGKTAKNNKDPKGSRAGKVDKRPSVNSMKWCPVTPGEYEKLTPEGKLKARQELIKHMGFLRKRAAAVMVELEKRGVKSAVKSAMNKKGGEEP